MEWEALKGNACEDIQRRGQGLQEHDGFEDIAVFLQLFTNTNKSFALINDDILQCFSAWRKVTMINNCYGVSNDGNEDDDDDDDDTMMMMTMMMIIVILDHEDGNDE